MTHFEKLSLCSGGNLEGVPSQNKSSLVSKNQIYPDHLFFLANKWHKFKKFVDKVEWHKIGKIKMQM